MAVYREEFYAKARKFAQAIAIRAEAKSPLDIVCMASDEVYRDAWMSWWPNPQDEIWRATVNLVGYATPVDTEETRDTFIQTYLLVLCEVCNIDIDTIIQSEDLKNENDREESPI